MITSASPDQYDDYLRTACGLSYWDGPPVALTLDQARAALLALAADADKEVARLHIYYPSLARAIRNAKQPPPAALVAALHQFTKQP